MQSNQIYKITRFTLKERDFWDLMFFFPPSDYEKDHFQFQDSWCGEKISKVIELIFEKNKNLHRSNVGDMLSNIIPEDENHHGTWFMRLVQWGRTFDYDKFPKFLVRNFAERELKKNSLCSFRIEEGNKRAVVFGLWLKINDYKYKDYPMIVVHSNSFRCAYDANRMKKVLGFDDEKDLWHPYVSSELEDDGALGLCFNDKESFETSDPNAACDKIVEFSQSHYGR